MSSIERTPGWTAVIPAAGLGRRLGFASAKIFYPILGKTLLNHLVTLLKTTVDQIVVVTARETRGAVEGELARLTTLPHACAVQPSAKGMADAVLCAEPYVHHDNTLVIWGDQITIRPETLRHAQKQHTANPKARATLPTFKRPHPYIRFVRNTQGLLTGVQEAREGTLKAESGESDCGVFCFQTGILFEALHQHQNNPACRGAQTGEYNLLPLIPLLETGAGDVQTFAVHDRDETQGLNTPEEAKQVEAILSRRGQK